MADPKKPKKVNKSCCENCLHFLCTSYDSSDIDIEYCRTSCQKKKCSKLNVD